MDLGRWYFCIRDVLKKIVLFFLTVNFFHKRCLIFWGGGNQRGHFFYFFGGGGDANTLWKFLLKKKTKNFHIYQTFFLGK